MATTTKPSNSDLAGPKTAVPPQQDEAPVQTDIIGSYIGSSVEYGFIQVDRALPQTIDDAERDFGEDIYDRMANDAILGGAEAFLKVMVLSVDLKVTPAISQPKQNAPASDLADYEKADAAAKFCEAILDRLSITDRPVRKTLWELLDAIRKGHRLAEVDAEICESGNSVLVGKVVPKAIRTKPRRNYAFVLDEYNTFRGIIAVVPGVSISLRNGICYGFENLPNAISPEKLLVLTFGGKENDPRGQSWFRRAYDPWYRKQIVKPEAVKTAVQFGGGMITAVAPETQGQASVTDPVTGKTVHIQQAIQSILDQLAAGGTATFPGGTKIDVHRPESDGKYFEDFFDRCDREMVTTFLLSGRAMLEARHGSKADSESSQDVVDDLVQFVRRELCDLITYKLFLPFLRLNTPDFDVKFLPRAIMQATSRPDFAAAATSVAALKTSGYLDNSQLQAIDREILGLPERDDNAIDPAADDEDPDADGDAKPNQGPAPGQGGPPQPGGKFPVPGGKGASNKSKTPAAKGSVFGNGADKRRFRQIDADRSRAAAGRKQAA